MFSELMPLLAERTVLITVARESDTTVRPTAILRGAREGENAALSTPLSLSGRRKNWAGTLDALWQSTWPLTSGSQVHWRKPRPPRKRRSARPTRNGRRSLRLPRPFQCRLLSRRLLPVAIPRRGLHRVCSAGRRADRLNPNQEDNNNNKEVYACDRHPCRSHLRLQLNYSA